MVLPCSAKDRPHDGCCRDPDLGDDQDQSQTSRQGLQARRPNFGTGSAFG